MYEVPTFRTERLLLRAVTRDDIPAYERYFVDYEVIRHLLAHVPWPYPAYGVREYVLSQLLPRQGDVRWSWGICERERPDALIGLVDLVRHGVPEHRGFWLGRAYWGRGYMTEAVGPVTRFAFEELGFETLVFAHARGNERSRRIKEKTGATFVRCEPGRFVDPAYTEREIWELTREAWERLSRTPARRR